MNGSELGQGYKNAREMTEEIERATNTSVLNAEIEASQEQVRDLRNLGREEAASIGSRVLTYNPESVAGKEIIASNEQVRAEADRENDYAGVGVPSEVQLKEREAWNEENFLNEMNPKRDYEAQIAAKDQRAIANSVAADVENLSRKKAFMISEAVELYNNANNATLLSYENPYTIGGGN